MRISLLLTLICILSQFSCDQRRSMPAPTDKTTVKMDMEDESHKDERAAYFEMVHGGPTVDWKAIEAQNAWDLLEVKRWLRTINPFRSEEEWVADGLVKGKWIERGSSNQAGSINRTAYDVDLDAIYAIGAGGPMFKGDRYGSPWTVVNDDLKFSHSLLYINTLDNGTKRIVAAINNVPHYSDDDGITWTSSSGIGGNGSGYMYDQVRTKDQSIYLLHKPDYWSNLRLFTSGDHGQTYELLQTFNTHDDRNLALTYDIGNDHVYIVEQKGENKSKLYSVDKISGNLAVANSEMPIWFGEKDRANLNAISKNDTLRLSLYREDLSYHESVDTGKTWTLLSYLSTGPWDVGVFRAPSNIQKLMYGEVNAYRSQSGGNSWLKINEWWEYYDNVEFKMHADIMCIDEYTDPQGKPFILIGNHGGINLSYDYGVTNTNIGMIGLNVGQFYDVRSYPPNPSRFLGGTQDQGLQKGKMSGEGPDDFVQIISGDYGHAQFTGPQREHYWTVYPGGSVSYYANPLSDQGPTHGYTINSKNETVWIPPTMVNPHESGDVIYIAGGSIDENSNGSHLIRLKATNSGISATELPFDFSISGGTISAMAVSPHNPLVWFVSTTNGYMYRSTNGGTVFTLMRKSVSEGQYLYGSCILPSKNDTNVVYLTGNGYGQLSPIYRSVDQGKSWSPMRSGMPPTTVFNIEANQDESLIFAATEAGPYVYVADKNKWFSLAGELTPTQTYWSVEYIAEFNIARFGTYGRGIWDFQVTSQEPTAVDGVNDGATVTLYPVPAQSLLNVTFEDIEPKSLKVYNQSGQIMRLPQVNSSGKNEIQLEIQALPAGVYFISGSSRSGKFTKRFVKV